MVRETPEQLIAVVRLRKDKSWVLPKGKLKPGEDAQAGARREVMEETGYDVSIEGFPGHDVARGGRQAEGRAVLAHAGDRRSGAQADGRCDGGEMVAVAAGGRHPHAPTRKGISHERGPGGSAGRPNLPRAIPPPSLRHRRFLTTPAWRSPTRFSKRSGPGSGAWEPRRRRFVKLLVEWGWPENGICLATGSNVPVLFGEWLEPGQHVTSIVASNKGVFLQGSVSRPRREFDDAVIARADRVVATLKEQAIMDEQADLFEPVANGITSWDKIADLGELVAGKVPGTALADRDHGVQAEFRPGRRVHGARQARPRQGARGRIGDRNLGSRPGR